MSESRPGVIRWRLRQAAGLRLQRLLFRFLDVLIWLSTSAGLWNAKMRALRRDIEVRRGIDYFGSGSHRRQRLDIYRPRRHGDGPLPVVFYVHGGGFSQCSLDTHVAPAVALASRGFLVINVDYRLAPEEPWPAAPHDVSLAWRWMAEHAADYGGDLERLHVAGESAGGNLVSTLLIGCGYRRPEPWLRRVWDSGLVPRTVHVLCGYLQVSDPARYAHLRDEGWFGRLALWIMHRFARNYLGPEYREASERNLLMDPARFFETAARPDRPLPRIAVSTSNGDLIYGESVRLARALENLADDVRLLEYPREPHGFQLLLWRAAARQFWEDTQAWIDNRPAPAPGTATARAATHTATP